uniref:uncharacterized protein LOC131127575 isoform X1 n=1 Tax=Doryrhamphus excisus TaxID=161450 RepID=UPI0025AE3ED6|nr:uncharacterized protein LOC131127575 isoform X1 [Doryrhamphus excisus]XP_057925589.1 uncharacterized protein LOC131127575 isoform X1 [Doryrhamphus excisus]
MEKILNWTPVKSEDVKALQSFSLFLRGCSNLTEQFMYMKELDLPSNMRSIILKLPYKLREKWRNVACDLLERRGQRAVFTDLVTFIERQVKIASDPLFGNIQDSQRTNFKASNSNHTNQRKKQSSFATNVTEVQDGGTSQHTITQAKVPFVQNCLFCSQSSHSLDKCSQFEVKVHRDKITFLKEKGICFGCLKLGHTSKDCRSRLDCNVCHQKHPGVLHIHRQDTGTSSPQRPSTVNPSSVSAKLSQTCGHIGAGCEDDSVFSIVAVKVKSQKNNQTVQTYAFLDPGSSGTFCTDTLARKLNLRGKKASILLRTMGQRKIVNAQILSGLEVSGMDGNDFIELPDVLTQRTMPVSAVNIPRQEDVDQWSYLKGVKLHDIDADVELLIGTDAPKVMEPWELINSQDEGPYAVRTRIGWAINGPLRGGSDGRGKSVCPTVTTNRISVDHLQEMLVKQYNHDFNEKSSEEKIEMSREDIKFMDLMNNTANLIEDHYCIDLPFRQENPMMPNNRCVAEQRLQSLKRKFNKNGHFKEEYVAFLNDMINKGYAERVPDDQMRQSDGTLWYIPHHGVHHSRKGKLRVVFDCGAVYKGTSLNSQLLQGPDLTSSLIGVLLRFRQEPVAVMADIQAMFHQVRVSVKHVDFLRFLWWPQGDTAQSPVEHRMKVHLFGAVSSPSCANYALRRTADDNAQHFSSDVVNTVKCNFYVDDCLKSMASEEEAVQMVKDLTALCQKGGFNLSKWISNSRKVLMSIAEDSRAKEIMDLDLDTDQLPVERALGLQWCIESDKFKFRTSAKEQPQTRRGILSVVSSLYDPLGFLAPFILPAKLLLQELCRRNLGWDEAIMEFSRKKWSNWLEDLQKVAEFEVDRCFKPREFGDHVVAQLHHFSDASEVGYGTASYLRLQTNGKVYVSFLLGKGRVAPLKQMTIPRLELVAAVLAVRVAKLLQKELQLQLKESVFWTDSTTVLKYIRNETSRFHTFVANRAAYIREATDVDQWRYVSSKENPADEASRGMRAEDFLKNRRWIIGPEFLWRPKEEWPKLEVDLDGVPVDDPEVKRNLMVNAVIKIQENATTSLISYFSSWTKLKTAVAWFLKIKMILKILCRKRMEFSAVPCQKVEGRMQSFKVTLKGQSLTPEDYDKAEKAIVQYEQRERFKVEAILNSRPITKVSDDPDDLEALTPNHILTLKGKPIMPPGLFDSNDLYLRKRWKQVQYMAELFWKRWLSEYLPLMQERQKWTRPRRSLTTGDIVLVADAAAPRGSWMMGKVLDVKSDAKGLVRSVRLQTKTSILERPVTKLCLLLEAAV